MTNIAEVEVLHAIKIPAGGFLDGNILPRAEWAMPGRHEIDADMMSQMGWQDMGYVEPEKINGTTIIWPCCCSHN